MDNQIIQPKIREQRIALITLVIILIASIVILGVHWYKLSDPYIKEVLAIQGDVDRGNDIFQINCAGCHGPEADGDIGPSLRSISKHRSKINLIEQIISGKTPPMPKFQTSTQEMADLLSYLQQI